jgi:glucose/arabinose dehydrogenase
MFPGSVFTNGGFLKFGPDGKLYVGTGTVSDSSHLPQDLDSLSGKILRLNDDGTIPKDNPYTDSPVYSLGFRNPQGMTWDNTGNMYVIDLGPDKNDEINLIKAGKNFGWPEQECLGNEKFEGAVMCYDPGIEPGGILFYSGDAIQLEHSFVMTSLRALKEWDGFVMLFKDLMKVFMCLLQILMEKVFRIKWMIKY